MVWHSSSEAVRQSDSVILGYLLNSNTVNSVLRGGGSGLTGYQTVDVDLNGRIAQVAGREREKKVVNVCSIRTFRIL